MKIFAFEKSVGAVLFRENNGSIRFLLLHYNSGHWDFPKGHVEKGENEKNTIRREIKEETGINEIEILSGFRNNIFYSYVPGLKEKNKKNGVTRVFKRVVYYVAQTKNQDVRLSNEHKGYRWLDYEQALAKISNENGVNILRKASKFLKISAK